MKRKSLRQSFHAFVTRAVELARCRRQHLFDFNWLGWPQLWIACASIVLLVGSAAAQRQSAPEFEYNIRGPNPYYEEESGNGSIRITEKGLTHVLQRHTVNGMPRFADKSKFNEGEDIRALINQVARRRAVPQANGNFARTYDVGREIGFDRVTAAQTSIVTVITGPNGELVTAFPGKP